MAVAQYVIKNGEHIDITGLPVQTELRCDACGEWMHQADAVTGSVTVMVSNRGQKSYSFAAHPEHTGEAITVALDQAAMQLPA